MTPPPKTLMAKVTKNTGALAELPPLGPPRVAGGDRRPRARAEGGTRGPPHLGVEADQRHLVSVLFRPPERLHLSAVDADRLERVGEPLGIHRLVVAQVD